MSRITSIEDLLLKVTDLEGVDDEKALSMVNEYLKSPKKKTWSKSMGELMKKYIEIIIYQNQIKYFKEALIFCRSLTQANYIEQFEGLIRHAKEILLEKYKESSEKYKDSKIAHRSLIDEEKEDEFNEEYYDSPNAIDEELFLKDQKFMWEAYKTLLDLTKTNSKLFSLYALILKDCFSFCGENQRNHEFKALCDSLRNHLFTLKKNENKPNFANKIQMSDPNILKILIQTSLNQIETANKLKEWEESFKTSEKIVSFIEEYEKMPLKDPNNPNANKFLKIPPLFELELYNYIQNLLWVSNYPLYHTYAMMTIKDLLDTNKSKMEKLKEKEKERLDSLNLGKINEKIVLAFLATPIRNAYTNFTKIGEELYEDSNDTEIKTCQKMMKILKVNHIPSRKYLLGYLLNSKIMQNISNNDIKELFQVFEYENNPLILAKKAVKYINKVFNNKETENEYNPYLKKIQENLIIKTLMLMPKIYKNISLTRINNLFKDLKIEEYEISDIISESSRNNLFKCKINAKDDLVIFATDESSQDKFNSLIEDFLKNSKKAIKDIIKHKNINKINILKDKIYEEIRNNNTKSLETTNNLLEETKKQNKKLKSYISKREKLKSELKERTAETKEMKKRLLLEREQLEREELKDLQKKKEYEIEIKKRAIDLLRKYTNSIVLKGGKRIKLDDLLKDLNKITEEELIRQLTDQENESVLKKEKELKKETKKKDYILREFRKRDLEKYSEESKKKWEESNKANEIKEKEFYDKNIGIQDEVLKYKSYKDEYCNEIEKKNKEIYQKEVEEYNKYLEKAVSEDIFNELDKYFAKYFEEFTEKEQKENEQKKAQEIWLPKFMSNKPTRPIRRGENYNPDKSEKKSTTTLEFKRSERADEYKEVEKERKKNEGFQRSQKFLENKKEEEEKKKAEKTKAGNTKKENKKDEKKTEKKEEKWARGGDSKKEDKKDEKKTEKKEENWARGGDIKKEDKKEEKWARGGDSKKEDKKDEKWARGGDSKKEDKKGEKWARGGDIKKEDKKEEKWARGGDSKKEEKKDEKWARGGDNKKEDKKEEKWARGGDSKKEEKKDEKWARGGDSKIEEKKDEKWARGGDSKIEDKKEEKKEDKKEEKKEEEKKEDKKENKKDGKKKKKKKK